MSRWGEAGLLCGCCCARGGLGSQARKPALLIASEPPCIAEYTLNKGDVYWVTITQLVSGMPSTGGASSACTWMRATVG